MAVFVRLSNYLKGRTSVNGLRSMVRQINPSILLPKTQKLIPAWQWSTFTTKSTFSTAQSPSSAHPSRVQKWKRLTSRSPPRLLQVSDGFFLNLRRFEYLWQDSENFKRPTKMPAPEYIEHLMAWVQGNIDNEVMFPSRIGKGFHNHCGFCSAYINNLRGCVSKDFSSAHPSDLQATLQSVCPHLLPSLSSHHSARTWTTPEYKLQALCFIHWWARLGER